MAEVVETRRSLDQYIMVQFMLNRSRIKAVRKDLLERWSKVMGVSREETRVWCLLSGSGVPWQIGQDLLASGTDCPIASEEKKERM